MKFRHLLFLFFVLLLLSPSLRAKEDIQLSIPLRTAAGAHRETTLAREDLLLYVNGQQREITSLVKIDRSLAGASELGRNFIFSFHMTEYTEAVEKGISYFVTEKIRPDDSLLLVTPLTIYQINVSANKEKMIRDIKQLLEKDCLQYRKNRMGVEKNLRTKIKSAKRVLDDTSRSAGYGARQILAAKQFLDTFPQEFIKFRELSLLLDTSKYRKITDLLGLREGERWWFHFHQEEAVGLLSFIRGFIRQMSSYVDIRERALTNNLNYLKRVLSIADSFPVEEMLNTIVSSNICYNVIAFGGLRISDQEAKETETSGLTRILSKVAEDSGGKSVGTTNPEEGVKEICAQKDSYYRLLFKFDGRLEKKEIKIKPTDKKVKLLYKQAFEKDELESLIHYLTMEKVKIVDFSQKKNVISFTVGSFKRQKKGKFGILKVQVELLDQQGTVVYRTGNTLRSSREKVAIQIPLPGKFRGEFDLRVTVNDLLANRRVSLQNEHLAF